MKKLVSIVAIFGLFMVLAQPANATDFTNSSFRNGFTATLVSSTDIGGGTTRIVATYTHSTATLITSGTATAGQIRYQATRLLQCDSSTISFPLNSLSAPSGCVNLTSTSTTSLSGNVLTVTYEYSRSAVSRAYVIPDSWWSDSGNDTGNSTPGNDQVVPTGSASSSSDSSPASSTQVPSPKIPSVNEFSSGLVIVTPGENAVLTGARLNCTTSISINDKSTSFTYTNIQNGQGKLSIAIPNNLTPGRHRLAMDSCGGLVVYENILMVSNAPTTFELEMKNGMERGMGLVKLRSFVKGHRADFNTVECQVDASLQNQKRIAEKLAMSFCQRALGLLASPKAYSTVIRSDNGADSIQLKVTLSNK